MNKEEILRYSPLIVVVFACFIQWNLFVTPVQLEQKHREILKEVAESYTTKEQYTDLKTQLKDIQSKIDKMYDIITNGRK